MRVDKDEQTKIITASSLRDFTVGATAVINVIRWNKHSMIKKIRAHKIGDVDDKLTTGEFNP